MESIDTSEQDRLDMERLAGGHDSALNALMERHAGPVYQFLFRMLNDEQEASDLAQETFVRVYRYRERYDGGKFTTWLYTIASNLARSEYRRRQRHPNVSLEAEIGEQGNTLAETVPSTQATPTEEAEYGERLRAVRQAVEALPSELREAVILCEWEELSIAEAATILNTSKRAVESRLYRARQRLRGQLTKEFPERKVQVVGPSP
jgi:RNA polymerase sigma-70 factor (ECF subfamily)